MRPASPAALNMGWLTDAACREEDPELFFPLTSGEAAYEQIRGAKNVCRRCPVRELCLTYAVETGQSAGIWGGTTEEERRKLRANRHPRRRKKRAGRRGPPRR